jgi:hypothetical protein
MYKLFLLACQGDSLWGAAPTCAVRSVVMVVCAAVVVTKGEWNAKLTSCAVCVEVAKLHLNRCVVCVKGAKLHLNL